jgi:predicted nuclease of predicted toxin-antitoxin system
LERGEDAAIVKWAGRNDYSIISKDTDFYQTSLALGYPRKFIWLRVGNCSTSLVVDLIRLREDVIREFIRSEAESVLILDRSDS